MSWNNLIDSAQAQSLMNAGSVLLLDVRDRLSYRCGHIPNAINFDAYNFKMFTRNINKHLPVVVYGNETMDAAAIAELLCESGFTQLSVLEGGYDEWIKVHQVKLPRHVCEWLEEHGYSCNDLNRRGFNGETALMFAARKGKTEYVVDLIDRGASIDLVNNDGNSAVWLACYSNDLHTLQALIESGAQIDIQNDNGATPLIYSASAGREEMVVKLLTAGADVHLATLDDFTALEVASTPAIMRLLRKAHKGVRPVPSRYVTSVAC